MKTITGMSLGTVLAQEGSVSTFVSKTAVKPKGFFSSWKMISAILLVMFSMFAVNASAVSITGASLTTTAGSLNATTSCVNGFWANTWTGSTSKFWKWQITTTGYENIVFATPTNSSATGPHSATYQWSIDNATWTTFHTLTWSGTGCTSTGNQALPMACDNQANVYVRAIMTGASGSSGTNRVSTEAFSGDIIPAACSGTPTAGSISAGTTDFCGSGATTLTLLGASTGAGISYQWQRSPAGMASWTNVGTSSNIYNTGTIAVSYDYQVIVTCSTGPASATTSTVTLTVNPLPATGTLSLSGANPFTVGDAVTVSSTVPGGSFLSSNTGILPIDGVTGTGTTGFGGTAVITYTVSDGSTLCNNSATINVDVVWPNTLALYAGHSGTSTDVIPGDVDAIVGTLTATGFGSNATCGSGGLSGLTVNTSVTSFANGNPHVYYKVNATAGNAINVFQIHARARVSGTGPTKAVLAYSYDGANWIPDAEVNLVSGSCGASANSWYWTTGGPTITGITGDFYVGIFPYASGSNSGVFQLNTLEVYGQVTTDAPCSGGSIDPGTIVALYNNNICGSGYRTLELQHDGGVGISYQWESSSDGMSWGATSAADTNVFFNTGTLTATTYYRVLIGCSFGGSVYSPTYQVTVIADEPHDVISGPSVYNVGDNEDFTTVFTNVGTTPDSVKWVSSYVNTADIDIVTGVVNPFVFPANDVRITRVKYVGGCSTATTDTIDIVHACAISYYLGENGTSTDVTDVQNVTSTDLVATGFGSGTPCGSGGKSGLNNAPASFSTSGAHVSFKTAVNSSDVMIINGIRATLRRSSTGPVLARLAYRVHSTGSTWGNWIDEGYDQEIQQEDCGYSMNEIFWGGIDETVPSFAYLQSTVFDSVEVAVFPFDASATSGTFQVNSITICGLVKKPCETVFIDMLDQLEEVVDGQTYPVGVNGFFVDGFTDAYWGIIGDANNPAYAYFDYNDITVGDVEGSLNIVSCYPSAQIFGVTDLGSCMSVSRGTLNFDCSPRATEVSKTIGAQMEVNFYPNPASTTINVVAKENVNVSIYGMDGKLILNQKDAKSINVSELANGVYFIKAYDAQDHILKTEKMIKQ